MNDPHGAALAPGIVAFGDFLVSGALGAYLRSSWRYAMFFLYPVFILFLIAGLCIGAALFSFALNGSYFISLLIFLGTAWLLLHAADRRLYLGLLIDDWIFARDYIRNGNGILADRLQQIAAEISRCHSSEAADETLVVGHSLGAVLAIDLTRSGRENRTRIIGREPQDRLPFSRRFHSQNWATPRRAGISRRDRTREARIATCSGRIIGLARMS